jgi:predicted nucleotidyltransferase component of viral defense system
MDEFLKRAADERADLFERVSNAIGLASGAVEKDFWVCWVLREVFRLEVGPHLAFKGGTSLSKCFGIIERFSEDIDLVIERDFLGFKGDQTPETASSGNERKRRVEAVVEASKQYVDGALLPGLMTSCRAQLGSGRISRIELDPDAEDGQAILIEYVRVLEPMEYVRPVVKLELGARSDVEPNEPAIVRPYLVKIADHGLNDFDSHVRVVAAERTFWEKVALLHEEGYRANGPRLRLARHYYDLWCMERRGIASRALADPGLFERVVEHRRIYFPPRREARDTLRRGSVRLIPDESRMKEWQRDFEKMQDSMFFAGAPKFTQIIEELGSLERRINDRSGQVVDG